MDREHVTEWVTSRLNGGYGTRQCNAGRDDGTARPIPGQTPDRSNETSTRLSLFHYPLSIIHYQFFSLLLLAASGAHAQLHYDSFASLDGLSMVGSAVARGSVINLTPGRMNDAGAIWAKRKQHVSDGFITRFSFIIRDTMGQPDDESRNGGDGLAFVVQNRPAGENALGGVGGQMGYGELGPLVAVEFDTYKNVQSGIRDPNGNHLSIQTNGAEHHNSMGAATTIRNLSDARVHTATVEYVNGSLRVYLDACAPMLLEADIDLSQYADANGDAWVGFTSATGSAWESHEIISWQFNPLGAARSYRGHPCDADSVTLTVRGDFLSYRWSNGSTARSITVGRSGTYNVTISDTNACSSLLFSWDERVELASLARPRVQVTGSPSLCEGDSVVLTAPAGFTSYLWSTGERSQSITARSAGRYAVTISDGRACTVTSDSVTVSVTPRPRPLVTASGPISFCEGESVVLEASAGFAFYQWSDGSSARSITVTRSGRYAVTVGASAGCRGTSDTVVVEVRPVPSPVIQIHRGALCESDSIVLDAGAGYESYQWSTGEQTQTILADSAGEYTVTVTNAAGCSATAEPVTIRPGGIVSPSISLSGVLPFCVGESVTLTVDQIYQSYLWNDGSTGRSLVVTSGGDYSVTVVDSAGCVGEGSIDVPEPVALPVVDILASGPTTLCEGESVRLSIAPMPGDLLWSTGATQREIVVRFAGIYHLTVRNGNCAASDTIRVDFLPAPVAVASADRTICAGESVRLQASGGSSYSWTPAVGLSCTDCADPIASPPTTTRYIVEVSDGGACSSFDTVVVTVEPNGVVDAGPDRTICRGDSLRLDAKGAAGYIWSPATGLSCSDCADPIVSPSVTTRYVVTPTGAGSCARPDTVTITVDQEGLVLQSYIERVVYGAPGETIVAPLVLEARSFPAGIDSIDIDIRYNPRVAMALPGNDPAVLLNGSLLAGWNINVEPILPGRLVIHLGSSGSGVLTGGRLLDLPFTLYLGDSTGTELTYDLVAHGNRCVSVATRNGRLQLDSICGLSVRLIEMGASRYSLGEIVPNPADAGADIPFAIGLDAPATIRIFDLQGREVGRPIDEYLLPGEYQLRLETASLPAGIYILRLESGEFTATRRLVVRR